MCLVRRVWCSSRQLWDGPSLFNDCYFKFVIYFLFIPFLYFICNFIQLYQHLLRFIAQIAKLSLFFLYIYQSWSIKEIENGKFVLSFAQIVPSFLDQGKSTVPPCSEWSVLLQLSEWFGLQKIIILIDTVFSNLMQGNVERRVLFLHQYRYRFWTVCSFTFVLGQIIKQVPILMRQVHHEILKFLNTEMRICSTEIHEQGEAIGLDEHFPESLILSSNPWDEDLFQESTDLNVQFHDILD